MTLVPAKGPNIRTVAWGATTLASLVVLLLLGIAFSDWRTAAALRARGAIAQGTKIDTICTDSKDSNGFSSRSCVGVWAYRTAAGEALTLHDRGIAPTGAVELGPGWGAVREGQVAYLPDHPSTARLRAEIAPELVAPLGGASLFAILATAFGAAAHWLLRPWRRPKPLSMTPMAVRWRNRRDTVIVYTMLIGIPVGVIAAIIFL